MLNKLTLTLTQHLPYLIFSFIYLFITPLSFADVSLPSIFSDHMVLQSNIDIPIWGWADPGENVTITLGSQTKQTITDNNGNWKVLLNGIPANQAIQLTVKGKNTITISDILSGEVWLAAGQSNMGIELKESYNSEIRGINFPQIRIYTEISKASPDPQDHPHGNWKIATPHNAANFSAVSFFYAYELFKSLRIPIGVIVSSTGGTSIETWMRRDIQQNITPPPQKSCARRTIQC